MELNLPGCVPKRRVRRRGTGVDAACEERAEAELAVAERPDAGG